MSWDSEDFTPSPFQGTETNNARWDDEDKSVKESWEEEETKPTQPQQPVTGEHKPKSTKKNATTHASTNNGNQPVSQEPIDKLEQRRLVEASDFQNTTEMFSGLAKDLVVDIQNPKDEKDFETLADTLSQKVIPFDKSYHYKAFLKSFLRRATQNLKVEDLKDLSAAMTVLANEKLKAEKPKKKKAGGATKKNLNVKADELEGDFRGEDDYSDFM